MQKRIGGDQNTPTKKAKPQTTSAKHKWGMEEGTRPKENTLKKNRNDGSIDPDGLRPEPDTRRGLSPWGGGIKRPHGS